MSIKFSVLLPTRERLDLLQYAVTSVLKQDYDDWEIIISDNHSVSCDIAAYVAALADPRIVYLRTQTSVPVTDNWNNALNAANGDYVIMLGDDDCLLKGYFRAMLDHIQAFDRPELIYTAAYIYGYPGVMPGYPDGFLQLDKNSLTNKAAPYILDGRRAQAFARRAMRFYMDYGFNMQYSLISQRCIERLKQKGEFFQSPYPDFYATNALFLSSASILVVPRPMVAIGISPKSYGFFHFNQEQEEGAKFLVNSGVLDQSSAAGDRILPGSKNNTSWLLAMECLKRNLREEMPDLTVDYRRYRLFQVLFAYKNHFFAGKMSRGEFLAVQRRMSLFERVFWGAPFFLAFHALKAFKGRSLQLILKSMSRLFGRYEWSGAIKKESYATILDVFERV